MDGKEFINASFVITPDLKKRLVEQAKKEDRSVSYVVRHLLEMGLACLVEMKEQQTTGHFEDL